MRVLLILTLLACMSFESEAQFWFGPKIGGQLTLPVYRHKGFKADDYKVSNSVNWHAGLAFQYTTEHRFAVHTELVYQKINNTIGNKRDNTLLEHKQHFNMIASGIHGRVAFGDGAARFYLAAGPRLSYWLSGTGNLISEQAMDNFGIEGVSYKIAFKEGPLGTDDNNTLFLPKVNRLQYGIEAAAGVMIDLAASRRLALEAKYTFGHSNIGFNDDIVLFEGLDYRANFQFTNNIISLSASYLFGYDAQEAKKGASTNELSDKQRKKRRKN